MLAAHATSEFGLSDLSLSLRRGGCTESESWPAASTCLIVVDLWDRHWCASATARVERLAPAVGRFVAAARARGVFIVHAPSNAASFYDGTPARDRALRAASFQPPVPLTTQQQFGTTWCFRDPAREPSLPIDDSDGGCDCSTPCENVDSIVWTRQHPAIEVDDDDGLTDDGSQLFNMLAERGIRHALICGVHLNMCVLGRGFGVRQLLAMGMRVALVRDLTDAMYSPAAPPHVTHDEGTRLVVSHTETHLCPTIASTQLTGGEPFSFFSSSQAARRPLDAAAPRSKRAKADAAEVRGGGLCARRVAVKSVTTLKSAATSKAGADTLDAGTDASKPEAEDEDESRMTALGYQKVLLKRGNRRTGGASDWGWVR